MSGAAEPPFLAAGKKDGQRDGKKREINGQMTPNTQNHGSSIIDIIILPGLVVKVPGSKNRRGPCGPLLFRAFVCVCVCVRVCVCVCVCVRVFFCCRFSRCWFSSLVCYVAFPRFSFFVFVISDVCVLCLVFFAFDCVCMCLFICVDGRTANNIVSKRLS